MILRNHGTLTAGKIVSDAFLRMYNLERACKAQVLAMSDSEELELPTETALQKAGEQGRKSFRDGHSDLVWTALLRMLDRRDSSFRD